MSTLTPTLLISNLQLAPLLVCNPIWLVCGTIFLQTFVSRMRSRFNYNSLRLHFLFSFWRRFIMSNISKQLPISMNWFYTWVSQIGSYWLPHSIIGFPNFMSLKHMQYDDGSISLPSVLISCSFIRTQFNIMEIDSLGSKIFCFSFSHLPFSMLHTSLWVTTYILLYCFRWRASWFSLTLFWLIGFVY